MNKILQIPLEIERYQHEYWNGTFIVWLDENREMIIKNEIGNLHQQCGRAIDKIAVTSI